MIWLKCIPFLSYHYVLQGPRVAHGQPLTFACFGDTEWVEQQKPARIYISLSLLRHATRLLTFLSEYLIYFRASVGQTCCDFCEPNFYFKKITVLLLFYFDLISIFIFAWQSWMAIVLCRRKIKKNGE